jgi:DNA-binding NarL/FixJ family response regulator
MNDQNLKIAIADPSVIIRSGLSVSLKRVQGIHVQTFEIASLDFLSNQIRLHKPDLLIVNPQYWGAIDLPKLRSESNHKSLKCFALLNCMVDDNLLQHYDDTIHLIDSIDTIKTKLEKTFGTATEENKEESSTLSQREKEIISCVVRGQINKEIAETLFLSTHTVITHRRNIARKLGIHSTAGLTIYAIVNKLVELDDISKTI